MHHLMENLMTGEVVTVEADAPALLRCAKPWRAEAATSAATSEEPRKEGSNRPTARGCLARSWEGEVCAALRRMT
jgi:hypothetical protein